MTGKQNVLAHRGLTLPRSVVRRLYKVGIFAEAHVSLEHQHLARRYVVRGMESGGAIKEMGRYVTFCGAGGEPLPYLYPIDSIGVNGLHAVVVAPILVRMELFRSGRTCQLLITRHEPGEAENGARPPLLGKLLFCGVNGSIALDAPGDDRRTFSAIPRFWTRAGETQEVPSVFVAAIRAVTVGASCIGCSHNHFLIVPGCR